MRGVLVLAVLAAALPAYADDTASTFHKGQIGLSLRFGAGLRGIATYDSKLYCGTSDAQAQYGNASVCTARSPFRFDVEGAYGVGQHVEVLLAVRLGLERDFGMGPGADGPRPLDLSPGVRFFFSEAAHTKLFATVQAVFDFSGYKNAAGEDLGADIGLRTLQGVWIDLHPSYGFYMYIGATAEVRRWLLGEFEGGIGFQARYP